MLEDLPGGLEGLRTCIEDFHAEGVKVLLPYNPWDQGTRNLGIPDYEKLVDQIVISNADGFNGDVLDGVNKTYWDEGIKRNHPIVMEPEVLMSNYSYLSYNAMSWGYWTPGKLSFNSHRQKSRSAKDFFLSFLWLFRTVGRMK